ncbi:MAG: ABC transporter substrate-binding protein [Candidatus Binatia bacterium]|nr:ABC transporter substrate-binding protein [Candidatus Binatia bacterium]
MLRRWLAVCVMAGLPFLSFLPVVTWAVLSPLEVIRSGVNQAIAVLQDPAYQGTDRRQQRIAKVREVVLPLFDTREIAKRALGVYWRERTEEEQEQFVALFTELVEKTYSGTLDRYTANVEFYYDEERIEGNFADVATRIFDPAQQKTFSVVYKLHRVGDRWLIYDIVAENVSMVRNYRNQFNRILNKSSYEDLVQTIQNKIKELSVAPAPS